MPLPDKLPATPSSAVSIATLLTLLAPRPCTLPHSSPMARPSAWPRPCPKAPATHGAAGLNLGPLQGDGDAVEKDEGQDDVVKELVGDDGLAQDPEPEQSGRGP